MNILPAIVIPKSNQPVPRGWAEQVVLPAIEEMEDAVALWGDGTLMQGLIATHKAKGHDVRELQAGKLFVEIRIGELLGPGIQGQHLSAQPERCQVLDIQKTLKSDLRRLAWYGNDAVKHIAIQAVRNGKHSRGAVIRYIDENMAVEKVEQVSPIEVRKGRFQDVLENIPDGTVDLILTDPPYPAEFLPEWTALAEFAAAKLVDGGSLVAYSGQGNLPEVISRLSEHLRYWWTMALLHGHGSQNLPGKFVTIGWKPILWFVKGNRRSRHYVADRLEGSSPRKTMHEWGQGRDELKPIITSLTAPGELVVDPFAGSGTTGEAAVALKRRFIGAQT